MKYGAGTAFRLVAICYCAFMAAGRAQAGELHIAPGRAQIPIPIKTLGASVDRMSGMQPPVPAATGSGYRFAAQMQALEAEVTADGLMVTSLAKAEGSGSFSIVPVALNGVQTGACFLHPARPGNNATVMLDRGCVREQFSASADGIRQDFIIPRAPGQRAKSAYAPFDLVLTLSVRGAAVSRHRKDAHAALLTLPQGRKLVYGKLHVRDAAGRELPARMTVPAGPGSKNLQILVGAQNAVYPITIDPTIIDYHWEVMSPGLPEANSTIYALALDAKGNLYAGGDYLLAGGVAAHYIAKWDGATWSSLGSGIAGIVYALAVDAQGTVYAGGAFRAAGGISANYVAKWNGTSWSALGPGMGGIVYALALDVQGNLYAGGSANYIAKWDGSGWFHLGSGMDSWVMALAVDAKGAVYAGGYFTSAGGVAANYIAKWDGTGWSPLGSGMEGTDPCVSALAVDPGGNVYAGGSFVKAGGVLANGIAKWNGANWSDLKAGMGGAKSVHVYALALDAQGNVYAGGSFTQAGGVAADYIAKWDGISWSALEAGMKSWVTALAVDAAGNLYAGVGA